MKKLLYFLSISLMFSFSSPLFAGKTYRDSFKAIQNKAMNANDLSYSPKDAKTILEKLLIHVFNKEKNDELNADVFFLLLKKYYPNIAKTNNKNELTEQIRTFFENLENLAHSKAIKLSWQNYFKRDVEQIIEEEAKKENPEWWLKFYDLREYIYPIIIKDFVCMLLSKNNKAQLKTNKQLRLEKKSSERKQTKKLKNQIDEELSEYFESLSLEKTKKYSIDDELSSVSSYELTEEDDNDNFSISTISTEQLKEEIQKIFDTLSSDSENQNFWVRERTTIEHRDFDLENLEMPELEGVSDDDNEGVSDNDNLELESTTLEK